MSTKKSVDLSLINKFHVELINHKVINELEDCLRNGQPFGLEKAISDIPRANGIYLFQIHCDQNKSSLDVFIKELRDTWQKRESEQDVGKYPKISYDLKENNIFQKDGWIPFYLGISKDLHARIGLHISKENDSTSIGTWALKLKRSEALKEYEFKFSYIEFGDLKSNYFICEILELLLRERINPIIGE